MKLPGNMGEQVGERLMDPGLSRVWRYAGLALVFLLIIDFLLGWYWSGEPDAFDVQAPDNAVAGEVTTATLVRVADTLLEKPGGYLSNDLSPHRLWLDNMPNWEFGVLVQVRDMARVMRRDLSRSQSQSEEDRDLMRAEPQFNFDNASWAMPATESEYRRGVEHLASYLERLRAGDAHFYARADNLNYWLNEIQNRLGSLSLQLSQSVGKDDLAGDGDPGEAGHTQTAWTRVDDRFYEARGACWALIHLLKAAEKDFADVLDKKNARVSYQQVVRELEATQDTVWSPMIMNGAGFGLLPNHSLVMANYISRANAAIGDLRQLLSQG